MGSGLSIGRADGILTGAVAMQPILEKARELGRAPTPDEVYGNVGYLSSAQLISPLRFRKGDSVSDVRRLITDVIFQAGCTRKVMGEFFRFPNDAGVTALRPLLTQDTSVQEMLSLTRAYDQTARRERNVRGISGRQSRLVDAVRWSIPPDGLFGCVRWALGWHFPHRVSGKGIKECGLRADDTPESIRRALDEILTATPEIADIIDRPIVCDTEGFLYRYRGV